jgi:hypothetical protein
MFRWRHGFWSRKAGERFTWDAHHEHIGFTVPVGTPTCEIWLFPPHSAAETERR